MMIDVKERDLSEIFSKHKANGLNELDTLYEVCNVQKFDVTQVLIARHVAFPQIINSVASAENVHDKINAQKHLNDVVHSQKSF